MLIDGVGCAEAQGQLLCVRVRGTGVGLQRGAAVIGGWGCVALCWESKQSLRLAENPASFSQAAGRSGQIAAEGDGVPQAAQLRANSRPDEVMKASRLDVNHDHQPRWIRWTPISPRAYRR